MKLLKIIFKAKGKKTILEFILISLIFIASFFSFTYFMEEYNTKWNKLIGNSTNPDLEIYLNLNSSIFLSEYNTFNQHFNNLNHRLITKLPRNLINLTINNITIDSVSFFIVNNKLNVENPYIIADETSLLVTKNSTLPNRENIQIDWNSNTSLDFFNVSQVVGKDYFSEIFGSAENYYALQETSIYNIIIKDTDFLSFVYDIGISKITSLINQERIKLFSLYTMNKTSYLNLLPIKLRNGYNNWVSDIEIDFFTYLSLHLAQNEYFNDFSFNDIFKEILEITIQQIRFVFFNSLIFSVLISIFFLYLLYIIVYQAKNDQKIIISILSSRGVKFDKIRKYTFLFQSIIAGGSLIASLCISWIFLYVQQIYSYSILQLVFFISHFCTFLCIILIIQKTNTILKDEKVQMFEDERKKISKSELFNIGIQVSMIVLILIVFAAFWTINSILLESLQLSANIIWYLVLGLILSIGLLVIIPRVQISILNWITKKLTKVFTPVFKTIAKTLTSISKKRRRILTICFYMMFFLSLVITSFVSMQNQKNDFDKSLRLYDYSLITDPETSSEIINICGYNNCLVSFIDQVFTVEGTINVIYLSNPLEFFQNSYFKNVKFEKHSNEEVFKKLNLSSSYVISSSIYTKEKQYFISENITIPRTQFDKSIVYDINTLYDYAYYLPFFSLNNPRWFLKKYEESQFNLTDFQYAITSIKRQNNNIEEAINYLELKGSWYSIKHDETDVELSNTSKAIILLQLHNSTIIVSIILPIFLVGLLSSFIFDSTKYFEYLKLRGLRNKEIHWSQAIWISMFLLFIFTASITCAIIILGLIFYTHNSIYGFPIRLDFSWISIITFIALLLLLLILIFIQDLIKLFKINKRKERKNKIGSE